MNLARHRSDRRTLVAALALLGSVGMLLAGCGDTVGYTEGTGDKANGKVLFTEKCGTCHTLADAGTTGEIGPNLDDAFAESRRSGLGEDTFVQVVRDQIAYAIENPPTGAPGMPADLVTGQDADDVAVYVASVAGTGATANPVTPPSGGDDTGGTNAAGKTVFTAQCGSCHTLADAGTSGTIGPNLDDKKPSAARVKLRVTKGQGVMPSFSGKLMPAQIEDVVDYVSSVAGT